LGYFTFKQPNCHLQRDRAADSADETEPSAGGGAADVRGRAEAEGARCREGEHPTTGEDSRGCGATEQQSSTARAETTRGDTEQTCSVGAGME